MDEVVRKRPRGRPRSVFKEPQGATVQALDRGLGLLVDIANSGSATLADISLRNAMPASTAHRILSTLAQHGFVGMDEDTQQWSIGMEAFRVGSRYLAKMNVVDAARPAMRELMETTGETSNLAIPDAGDVVFISQVESHNPIRAFFRPGTRGHMHCSGIGKALLSSLDSESVRKILRKKGLPEFTDKTLTSPDALFADLEMARIRGWALDDEERYPGMRCVAAPIYNSYGEAIAGISVSGPAVRFPDQAVEEIGPLVRRSARSVMQTIGGKVPE